MDKYFMLMNPTYTASRILNENLYLPEERLQPESRATLQHICGRYYPMILLGIDFFMAQYAEKNITLDEIAEAIALSFSCGVTYAKKIIKCYRGMERFICELRQEKEKTFNFNISLMKTACETCALHGPIHVPEQLIKNLLLLSNYMLPISDITSSKYKNGSLIEETGPQIHEDLRHIVDIHMKQLNEIFDARPDKNFWYLFFKYFPRYANNGYFLECIYLSIRLDEEQVYKLMPDTYIHKSTDTAIYAMKEYAALKEYVQALEALEKYPSNQFFSAEERNELFKNMLFGEFSIILRSCPAMVQIADHGLRSCDLKLAYWLLLNYNADDIDRFFDDLIYEFFVNA